MIDGHKEHRWFFSEEPEGRCKPSVRLNLKRRIECCSEAYNFHHSPRTAKVLASKVKREDERLMNGGLNLNVDVEDQELIKTKSTSGGAALALKN